MKEKKTIGPEPIYDARTLGMPKMLILGLQHMFAMFGATVLVPILFHINPATVLLFNVKQDWHQHGCAKHGEQVLQTKRDRL